MLAPIHCQRGFELSLEVVVLHEVEQVWRRLPVLDAVSGLGQAANLLKREELLDVIPKDSRRGSPHFGQHPIAISRDSKPLCPNHNATQLCFDPVSQVLEGRAVARRIAHQLPPIVSQGRGKGCRSFLACLEEPDGLNEIPEVVVSIRFVVQRVHLVGRRREQEHPNGLAAGLTLVGVLEQRSSQLRVIALGVEQVLEALELVENDQIRA